MRPMLRESTSGCPEVIPVPVSKPPVLPGCSWRAGDERGATAIEHGLLVALIAIAVLTSVSALGSSLAPRFAAVAEALDGGAPALTSPSSPGSPAVTTAVDDPSGAGPAGGPVEPAPVGSEGAHRGA